MKKGGSVTRAAILLLALALAGCASVPNPRHVEAEYAGLNCQELLQARWVRIDERRDAELRYYGGPGPVEWGVWGTAILALAFTEPASAGVAIGAAARMRQAQVKSKLDALNLHIDMLEALFEEECR